MWLEIPLGNTGTSFLQFFSTGIFRNINFELFFETYWPLPCAFLEQKKNHCTHSQNRLLGLLKIPINKNPFFSFKFVFDWKISESRTKCKFSFANAKLSRKPCWKSFHSRTWTLQWSGPKLVSCQSYCRIAKILRAVEYCLEIISKCVESPIFLFHRYHFL